MWTILILIFVLNVLVETFRVQEHWIGKHFNFWGWNFRLGLGIVEPDNRDISVLFDLHWNYCTAAIWLWSFGFSFSSFHIYDVEDFEPVDTVDEDEIIESLRELYTRSVMINGRRGNTRYVDWELLEDAIRNSAILLKRIEK